MASNLRQLLIQRAARLQERPALTATDWGTLSYGQFRNRVEGIALGILTEPLPAGSPVFLPGWGPWTWAAEVAAACCGLAWDTRGAVIPGEILGGPRFNGEAGRGPYHDREEVVSPDLPFHAGLDQGEVLGRLARLNQRLGWDHDTVIHLSATGSSEAPSRAVLWSALYAGAHIHLDDESPLPKGWFRHSTTQPSPDLAPFAGFWASGG